MEKRHVSKERAYAIASRLGALASAPLFCATDPSIFSSIHQTASAEARAFANPENSSAGYINLIN